MKISIKGLTWEYQTIMFLGFVIIALIIGFVFWYYIAHNRYERITEQNFKMLATAIDQVCADGSSQELTFYSPQLTGFKGQIAQMVGGVVGQRFGKTPGDVVTDIGKGLLGTKKIGEDPYFYVYYEMFPPEQPPPTETLYIVAPWREDMPWSNNLMSTMFFDSIFLGMDFGMAKVSKGAVNAIETGLKKGSHTVADKISEKLTKGGLKFTERHETIGTVIEITKTVGTKTKVVLKAVPKVAGLAAVCYFFTDQDIENCAVYATIGYVTFKAAQKVAPKMYHRFVDYLDERALLIKYEELGTILKRVAGKADDEVIQELIDGGIIRKVVDEKGVKYFVVDKSSYQALETLWEHQGKKDLIANFRFETRAQKLENIILEKTRMEGFANRMKNGWNKIKEVLDGRNVMNPKKFGSELTASVNDLDFRTRRNIILNAQERGLFKGIDPNDVKQVNKIFDEMVNYINTRTMANDVLALPKDSGFQFVAEQGFSGPQLKQEFDWYFQGLAGNVDNSYAYLAKHGNEYDYFHTLSQKGYDIRMTDAAKKGVEKVKKEFGKHPAAGYAWLRFQDTYTMLGVTYWDMEISPYHLSIGACAPESLCLTTGSVVGRTISRRLENCAERGYDIKLERGSMIAANPRFYLVSPCFTHLNISRKGDTVYVKPLLCSMDKVSEEFKDFPNYCYATAGTVNWYVGLEHAAFWSEVGVDIACIVGTSWTVVGPFFCTYVGDILATVFDMGRESLIVYPYVQDIIQDPFGAETWLGECGAIVTD